MVRSMKYRTWTRLSRKLGSNTPYNNSQKKVKSQSYCNLFNINLRSIPEIQKDTKLVVLLKFEAISSVHICLYYYFNMFVCPFQSIWYWLFINNICFVRILLRELNYKNFLELSEERDRSNITCYMHILHLFTFSTAYVIKINSTFQ